MHAYHMHLHTQKTEVLTGAVTWISLEGLARYNKPVTEERGLEESTDPRFLVPLTSSGQKAEHGHKELRVGGKSGCCSLFLL